VAIKRRRPPQRGHVSTSMSKARRIRAAHAQCRRADFDVSFALAATVHAECALVLWERWFAREPATHGCLGSKASRWACNRASESEYAQGVRKG
jgi:hypothetical protein